MGSVELNFKVNDSQFYSWTSSSSTISTFGEPNQAREIHLLGPTGELIVQPSAQYTRFQRPALYSKIRYLYKSYDTVCHTEGIFKGAVFFTAPFFNYQFLKCD